MLSRFPRNAVLSSCLHAKRSIKMPTKVRSLSTNVPPPKEKSNRIFEGGPISYFGLGLAALVGCGLIAYYNVEKEKRVERVMSKNVVTTGKPSLGGPWSLVDYDGVPKTNANYLGKFTLVYFGFTHCPDICPSELVKIGKIVDELDRKPATADKLKPIFISVDPVRDTVAQLKTYAQDFHPKFAYLTGTNDQVAQATRFYRVYFSKVGIQFLRSLIEQFSCVQYRRTSMKTTYPAKLSTWWTTPSCCTSTRRKESSWTSSPSARK